MDTQATQLEIEILANLICYKNSILKIKPKLPINAFLDSKNREIYKVCRYLEELKKPITKGSVCNELQKNTKILFDWNKYIENIVLEATTEEYLDKLVDMLIEKHRMSEISRLLIEIEKKISSGTISSKEIQPLFQNELLRLFTLTEDIEFEHIETILTNIEENARARQETGGIDYKNYSTGFKTLNKILHGFKPGQLIIIAGRPSMGKTTLALNFVANFTQEYPNKNVTIISREVASKQLVLKLLAAKTANTTNYIEGGYWLNPRNENEKNTQLVLLSAIDEYKKANIFFDDTFNSDITKLYASLKVFLQKGNVGMIIVDYIQLLEDRSARGRTRENEVAKISRTLKQMAIEFDCPVIALSQLGRRSEIRKDGRPILSDLRESGAIEQDADVVILLHSEDREKENKDTGEKQVQAFTDLDVAKNRNGPTGMVTLLFIKQQSLFREFSQVSLEE